VNIKARIMTRIAELNKNGKMGAASPTGDLLTTQSGMIYGN
jgi:hypothetical protein